MEWRPRHMTYSSTHTSGKTCRLLPHMMRHWRHSSKPLKRVLHQLERFPTSTNYICKRVRCWTRKEGLGAWDPWLQNSMTSCPLRGAQCNLLILLVQRPLPLGHRSLHLLRRSL